MRATKRILCIALVICTLVSVGSAFSVNASAATNCQWKKAYCFVTNNCEAAGTNTFIITSSPGRGRPATIRPDVVSRVNGEHKAVKDVYDAVDFKVVIKDSKGRIVDSFVVDVNETFYITGFYSKRIVSITPIVNRNAAAKIRTFKNQFGSPNLLRYALYNVKVK